MKVVKVMLVDDEVLAIQHMKQLLSWENHGYDIVCESTHPPKALELFAKHKPHILIVDIKMPVMDGIEFSKRALSINPDTKIILLTSYKEFEYAKEALHMGVSHYWLKHEVQADTLLADLTRIRRELEMEERTMRLLRRQMLSDALSGRELLTAHADLLSSGNAITGQQLSLLLLQQDRPFPVLEVEERGLPVSWESLQDELGPAALEFSMIELLHLSQGRAAAVLVSTKCASQKQLWDRIFPLATAIQEAYKSRYCGTLTVVIAGHAADLKELFSVLRHSEGLLSKSIFFGYGKVLSSELELPETKRGQADYAEWLNKAAESVKLLDTDETLTCIRHTFSMAAHDSDLEGLRFICREWVQLLRETRASLRMSKFEEMGREGKSPEQEWHSAAQIGSWLATMFLVTLEEAKGKSPLSKKVRQAMEYIQKHYAQEMTIESVAEGLGISGDRLRHLFKEETGRTLLDYITEVRIQKAKKLLTEGPFKIYEIAEKVGYRSGQYFSQVFRKFTGVNPLEYAEGKGALGHETQN